MTAKSNVSSIRLTNLSWDTRETKSIQYKVNINPPSGPILTKHLNLLLIRSQIKIRTKQSCPTPRYSHAQSNDCIWDGALPIILRTTSTLSLRRRVENSFFLLTSGLSNFTFTIPVAVPSWIKQRKLVVRLMDVFYFGRPLKSADSDPTLLPNGKLFFFCFWKRYYFRRFNWNLSVQTKGIKR